MTSKNKPYSDPRWHEVPVAETVGHVSISDEQKAKDDKFKKDFAEWLKEHPKVK